MLRCSTSLQATAVSRSVMRVSLSTTTGMRRTSVLTRYARVPQAAAVAREFRACSMVPFQRVAPAPVAAQLLEARRWQSQEAAKEGAKEGAAKEGEAKEGEAKEGEAKGEEGEKKAEPEEPAKSFLESLKEDIVRFPGIYNSANMMNFVLFTVFCLCSTGTATETDWWMNHWAVDGTLVPWAWPLHSILSNNFLSMSFAMILLHSMCHAVLPAMGSRALFGYCFTIATASGMGMWALNAYLGNKDGVGEKQFGPWDIVGGLFVMQFLHHGTTPFTILGGFHGWVKYASFVGAACIMYYDWQPLMFGSVLGLLLCKTKFPAPVVKAAG